MVAIPDLVISKWVGVFVVVITLLAIWVRSKFSYWKNRNIPYLKPTFPWGNVDNPLISAKGVGLLFWDFYKKAKKEGFKYVGFYMSISPIFVPIDPDCIKDILIKDFPAFHGRGFYNNERDQPMSANLFTKDGPTWRTLRYKFSPIFTSGKIKYMYNLMVDCAQPLCEMVANSAQNQKPINAKDVLSRFTTDTIGSCAFGINCNSFKDSTLYTTVNHCLEESTKFLRFAVLNYFPNLCRFFRIGLFISKPLQYFRSVITDSYEHRKNNLVYRTDFLQLMKDMQEKKSGEDFDLTMEEILAQAFLFFVGGYETSSTAMTYLLLELAENVKIQEKIRQEICDVAEKHGGLTYEALQEMKYLQCAIDEILRMYPPVPNLNRISTEEYKLPNGEILEKGTNIIIPALAIHRDPEYYPNPDDFDPERFSDANKESRHPYAYLPFGDGPRNCIGSRFGTIQMKVAICHLLKRFRFTLNENADTTRKFTATFLLNFDGNVLLDVEEIGQNKT